MAHKTNEKKLAWQKEYDRKNKEKKAQYYIDNKEYILDRNKRWKENNKEKNKQTDRIYYLNNRDDINRKQRETYKLNRIKAIEQLGGVCSHPGCNCTEDLQFNHINPDDKLTECTWLMNGRYDNEDLQNELSKCNLLCKPHHIEETNRQRREKKLTLTNPDLT